MDPTLKAVLASIVSSSAIVGAAAFVAKNWIQHRFSTELERAKSALAQDTERLKVRLKKSEFIFEREFAAASAFLKIYDDFEPQRHHPDMEWEDAMEQIVSEAGSTEKALRNFTIEHGAALRAPARDALSKLCSQANNLCLEMSMAPPAEAADYASSLWKAMRALRDELLKVVRDQAE